MSGRQAFRSLLNSFSDAYPACFAGQDIELSSCLGSWRSR